MLAKRRLSYALGLTTPQMYLVTQFRLWLWDPHVSRWQIFSPPLNYMAKEGCTALCWSTYFSSNTASGSYLYAHYWSDGSALFRIRIPHTT
jgi:hypothetical protein